MPRTVSKLKNDTNERAAERAIRIEKPKWWDVVVRFLTARETRMSIGVLMLLFAIIALLSYISFLFTGAADQSVLALPGHAAQWAHRAEIHNMLGLPGARLGRFLIDGSFGFVSVLLVLM